MTRRDAATGRYVHDWAVTAHDHSDGFREFLRCDHCGKYREGSRAIAEHQIPKTATIPDSSESWWAALEGRDR